MVTTSERISRAKVVVLLVTSETSNAAGSESAPVIVGHAFSIVAKLNMPTHVWVLDRGCTQHMTNNIHLFHNLSVTMLHSMTPNH